MSTAALTLILTLQDNAAAGLDQIAQKIGAVGQQAQTADEKSGSGGLFGNMLASAGGFIAANVLGHITEGIGEVAKEMSATAEQEAQLSAGLASSGGVAGVTMAQMKALAEAQQDVTKFSKAQTEAVEKVALTFTSINQEVFPRTIALSEDMAQKLGMQGTQAMTMIGKAMDDPIKGLAALHKVGVSFTDQQKEQIKTMVAAGDTMGAQNLLLNELQKEYGGAAEASGKTLGGALEILKNNLVEAASTIVNAFIPAGGDLGATLASPQVLGAIKDVSQALAGDIRAAISWLTDTGLPAAKTAFSTVSGVIRDDGVPAVEALTGAMAVYVFTQIPAALEAVPFLIAETAAATAAFAAQAIAVAAAVAPFALLAAAIYGVVKAYQGYQDQVDNVVTKVENSSEAWKASTQALDDYSKASDFTKSQTKDLADQLESMRAKQTEQIRAYAQYVAVFGNATAEAGRQRDAINLLGGQITETTGALQKQVDAYQHLHDTDAVENLRALKGAHADLVQPIQLSEKELEKLDKEIEKISSQGVSSFQSLLGTEVGYMETSTQKTQEHKDKIGALEKELADARTATQKQGIQDKINAENTGFQQEETEAALSYARQQAAQLAHLGQMLIDYVHAEAQKNATIAQHEGELTDAIAKEYGVQESLSGRTFSAMTTDIETWSREGGGNADDLARHLHDTGEDAAATQQKMDSLAKKYTAELEQNFRDGKIDADHLRDAIEHIPTRVRSEVEILAKLHVEEDHRMSEHAGMAEGGQVRAGQSYLVGERGPELFMPRQSGTIVPNERMAGLGGTININVYGAVGQSADAIVDAAIRKMDERLRSRR